jgi:heptosyltransferase-1
MRILIVKTSAMGDIIHALPVLELIQTLSPKAEIDWIVEEPFADLLSGNPLISRLHIISTKRWKKSILSTETRKQIADVLKELRGRRYDIVFDIQGNLKSGIIALLSGCSRRIGLAKERLQERINAIFTNERPAVHPADDHATSRYLRVISSTLGNEKDSYAQPGCMIYTSAEDDRTVQQLLTAIPGSPRLLFHCGTTWQTKFWSESGWIELGRLVKEYFPQAAIHLSWGNESERNAAERIATGIGPAAQLLQRYSIKGITAVIKQMDVLIAGDTGLTHLAACVDTPTVSFYRASDGSISGPRGERHIIVQSPLHCSKCLRTSCPQDAECRKSIRAESILEGVVSLSQFFKSPPRTINRGDAA